LQPSVLLSKLTTTHLSQRFGGLKLPTGQIFIKCHFLLKPAQTVSFAGRVVTVRPHCTALSSARQSLILCCRRMDCSTQMKMVVLLWVLLLQVPPCKASSKKTIVDSPGTCSCQSPTAVPLKGAISQSPTAGVWLQPAANQTAFYSAAAPSASQIAAASAASYAAASAAAAMLPGGVAMSSTMMPSAPKTYATNTNSFCSQLPSVPPGGQCGAGTGICTQASNMQHACTCHCADMC
jgi:hypothetical protein